MLAKIRFYNGDNWRNRHVLKPIKVLFLVQNLPQLAKLAATTPITKIANFANCHAESKGGELILTALTF
ncbi:MAG: hypothetical protein H0X30_01570 [Anaerolineae bacterium]|nr:hypothetical protein [Anaerolineae bacterium]